MKYSSILSSAQAGILVVPVTLHLHKKCWRQKPLKPWGGARAYASIATVPILSRLEPAGSLPMLQTCSRIIALIAVVAGPSMAVQADTTLTLACQGTVTTKVFAGKFVDYEPEPISMGLINFTKRTVQGTGRWGSWLFDDQLPITELTEGTVLFEGLSKFLGMKVRGTMDRVTGDVGWWQPQQGKPKREKRATTR